MPDAMILDICSTAERHAAYDGRHRCVSLPDGSFALPARFAR